MQSEVPCGHRRLRCVGQKRPGVPGVGGRSEELPAAAPGETADAGAEDEATQTCQIWRSALCWWVTELGLKTSAESNARKRSRE